MNKELFNLNTRIQYRFPVKKGGKVLVLAPHPDDETIGCAGSIFCLRKIGVEVTVVLFTQPEDKSESENRLTEFYKATRFLGCMKHIMLGFPDGSLKEYYNSAKEKLEEIVFDEKPDIIFTPYIFDYHYDHKCVSEILTEVVKDKNVLIAMYEVWVPILHPDYYIDISNFWKKKQIALAIYESQEVMYSIIKKAATLNQLRAQLSMRRNVTYIETFRCFWGDKFAKLAEDIREVTTERGETG